MTDDKILFETKFLQMKQAPSPSGNPWYYSHRPNINGVVVIVPIIDEEILFLETYRPPIAQEGFAQSCIELPAGLVGDMDKQETLIDAAKKELLEETGLRAESLKVCAQNCASSSGATSEIFAIVIAKIKDKTIDYEALTSDGGIIKERHYIPKKDVRAWLKKQQSLSKSVTAQTYAGLFFANL
ncbi:MAG: NUDIX hydrolase [Candidatus Gastranaerophilales bacterium]|nr:NUDIX hydrolase [Candidatus Gastranaerophilales bacterium]